jgi:hypothetical protein
MTGPCLENWRGVRAQGLRISEAEFSPLACIDSIKQPRTRCAWKISTSYALYIFAISCVKPHPTQASGVCGASWYVERLMTRCSHRRSSGVMLFDLGMQLGALPISPISHRADSMVQYVYAYRSTAKSLSCKSAISHRELWCGCHWNVTSCIWFSICARARVG